MGFRSTFVTDDCSWVWPQWFRGRYPGVHFPETDGPISSKFEAKTYGMWDDEFIADIQKCLIEEMEREQDSDPCLALLFLHECGGVTRYQIMPYSLIISEPRFWGITGGVKHDYCYGCSVARDDLDMPKDYAAIIERHKARADEMELSRDSLRGNFQKEVNAKVREFIEDWHKQAEK